MFKQTFAQYLDSFYVTNVQVATVWTNPTSARELDQSATSNPTDIDQWLARQSYDDKLALCDENRVQSQLLYGEIAIVTETKGEWANVTIPSQPSKKAEDGYPGWVPLKQLSKVHQGDWNKPIMAAVSANHTWLETETGEKVLKLSYMTCLPMMDSNKQRIQVVTPHGNLFLPRRDITLFETEKGKESGSGSSIITAGERFIGLEYLWGGMSSFGYDCSGFAYAMHKANGYTISRDASDQAANGKEIPLDELSPGDLLFFAYQEGKGNIHHVGFYYGDGQMLHSPQTGKQIEVTTLANTKYEKELCMARRYWETGGVCE
ncbi:C40 family peptidase [Ornithinibacillus xuwenensis]|uniref:C40 family peptidase n=1 Tax=Ornithinibacillus xuwenensis TaxID=3144668 RepID=A0ABU9XJL5_9BACI